MLKERIRLYFKKYNENYKSSIKKLIGWVYAVSFQCYALWRIQNLI